MAAEGIKKRRNTAEEQLAAAINKKRECKANVDFIIGALLQPQTNPDDFLKMLKYINKCHYEDIVEERFILKLCGYPICGNVLAKVPTKKYQICTNVNKVYDITYRKMFCSSKCFKGSEYVRGQMLTSPLWLRDQETVPVFKLLSDPN